MTLNTPRQIRTLTALRFFAAAAIVFHHSPANWFGGGGGRHLSIGVDFFFVLSGFILKFTYPSLLSVAEARRFWLARFARLWPAHMSGAVFMYLAFPPIGRFSYYSDRVAELVANLAMVHAWIPLKRFALSFNTPSWSVSDEAFFYLFFPLLILGWRRNWLLKWLVCLTVLGTCMALANLPEVFGHPINEASLSVTTLLYTNPAARLFEFLLGISIAALIEPARALLSKRFFAASVAELVGLALLYILFTKIYLASYFSTFVIVFEMTIAVPALIFALLIIIFCAEGGVLSRMIQNKVSVRLGEISYSIYILHYPIMYYALYRKPETFAGFSPLAAQLTLWGVILIAAYLNWMLVEVPARRLIVQRFGAQRRALPAALRPGADTPLTASERPLS